MSQKAPGARGSELTPKQTYNAVMAALLSDPPLTPLLLGPPGVGKTHIIRQVGKALGMEVKEILLAQREPTDFVGIPYVLDGGSDGRRSAFAPPKDFFADKPMIIFLDEFLQAPLETQRAASEIILERRVGGVPLHPDSRVICASNRREDRAGTAELLGHNKSRLCTLHVTTSVDDWLAWAMKASIHPLVIQYIRDNQMNALYPTRKDHKDDAYACPRTWEKVSAAVTAYTDQKLKGYGGKTALAPLVIGSIGEGQGLQFMQWIGRVDERPSPEEIAADPKGCKLPASQEDQMSFAAAIMTGYATVVSKGLREPMKIYLSRMAFDTLVSAGRGLDKKVHDMPELVEDMAQIRAAYMKSRQTSAA